MILGMCNPLTGDPDAALEPNTPGGAGERLWRMIDAVVPISREEYCRRFDRINLVVSSRRWSSWRARARAAEVRSAVGSRPVVVLGRETWRALGLPADARWFSSHDNWHLVPHPSGRSRVYNQPLARILTGRLVSKLGGFR